MAYNFINPDFSQGSYQLQNGLLDPSRSIQVDPSSVNYGPQQQQTTDPWSGIDPRLAKLYQSYGINTPGAAGSGFTDAKYWNDTLNGSAGGDWNYIQNRLGSDLAGNGPDTPGPGDVGNRSGQNQNNGSVLGTNGGNIIQQLLQMFSGNRQQMNTGAMPYNQYAGKIRPQMSNYFGVAGRSPSTMVGAVSSNYGPQQTQGNQSSVGTSLPGTNGGSFSTSNGGNTAQPRYSWLGSNKNNNPMGAANTYSQSKPLPESNTGVRYY